MTVLEANGGPAGERVRRLAPWWTTAAAIGCLAAGVAATVGGVSARGTARDAQADADAVELVRIRGDIRRSHLDETNAVMLGAFGASTQQQIDDARETRQQVRDDARAALERIARGEGTAAMQAESVLEILHGDGLDDVVEADPLVLVDTGWTVALGHRPPATRADDELVALDELMITEVTAAGILNDGLDAEYVLQRPDVEPLLESYVAESEPYIRNDGGYLGSDGSAPLDGSYVYDARAQRPHPALGEVERHVVESGLWTYDQWIRSWTNGTPPPAPYTLDELVDRSRTLDTRIRPLVEEAIDVELDERTAAASSAQARAVVLLGAAALMLLVPVIVAGRAVRRRFRAVTDVAARVALDPLTGAANRHHLRSRTEPALADPSYRWHLVAAIDMDRFKLINDSWGHAVGDRVLVEVARHLRDVVDEHEGSGSGASGSVVRLGGDEFLLVLHGRHDLDVDRIANRLSEIRTVRIPVGPGGPDDGHHAGARVELAFSFGIATATSPVVLDDLMRAADLAAYEEKAHRSPASGHRVHRHRHDEFQQPSSRSGADGGSTAPEAPTVVTRPDLTRPDRTRPDRT